VADFGCCGGRVEQIKAARASARRAKSDATHNQPASHVYAQARKIRG